MNIALAAYGSRKVLMENFCMKHGHILNKHRIFAVEPGGEQQIATRIALDEIQMVFLFADYDESHDIFEIIRVCNAYNVPLATNAATAEAFIKILEET